MASAVRFAAFLCALLRLAACSPPAAQAAVRIFFDLTSAGAPLGRVTFELAPPSLLPMFTSNLATLATTSDSTLSYAGCAFDFDASCIHGSDYAYVHRLAGRGENARGLPPSAAADSPAKLLASQRLGFGGAYYGLEVEDGDPRARVVLTVPAQGARAGRSELSIVRVADSPEGLRQKLLLNSAVIGLLVGGEGVVEALPGVSEPPVVDACGMQSAGSRDSW